MDKKENIDFCNEKRFSDFFLGHSRLLHNFIFYKCGNAELTKDIVQEAFLKLWNHCKKIVPGKSKSFLFTIATNIFLNEYAKNKVAIRFRKIPKKEFTNESPEFLMEENEFGEKLQNAISKLSEGQRTAFLMNRIDGKKYREIAEILGISIKAVEKRIHTALVKLRAEIENI